MKITNLPIILFALIGFISCEEEQMSTQHEVSESYVETTAEAESPTINASIDGSSIESFVTTFKKARQLSLGKETDLRITHEVFFQDGIFTILNLQEINESGEFHYAISLNSEIKNENPNLDGVLGDVNDLLHQQLKMDYGFYSGNFRKAPDYETSLQFVVLTNLSGYRTTIDNFEHVYQIENHQLKPTDLTFVTRGESGICEELDGIAEQLGMNENPYWVGVNRIENIYQDCELLCHFNYQKIWDLSKSPNLKSAPHLIQTGYSSLDDIAGFPKELYLLTVQDGDTLIVENEVQVFNENTLDEIPFNWSTSYRTTYDAIDAIVVYFEKKPNGEYLVVERGTFSGPSSAQDPYAAKNVLDEEQEGRYTYKIITMMDSSGIYTMKYNYREDQALMTSNPSRFKVLPDETDFDF